MNLLKTFLIIGFYVLPTCSYALAGSIKNAAMANAGVAYPLDSLAAAYNPAGMIEVGDRIDLGVTLAHYDGHTRIRENFKRKVNRRYSAYATKNFYAPSIGANKMFCYDNLSLGISIFEKDYVKTNYSKRFKFLGTSRARLEYVHYTVAPTIAYRVAPCHTLGLSINGEIQTFRISGLRKIAKKEFSIDRNHVTNKGIDYSLGVSATIGWLWQAFDYLKIGISYQTPSWMQSFEEFRGSIADCGRFNPPQNITAGFSWNIYDDLALVFDVQYIWWEDVRALKNRLKPNLFESKLGEKDGVGLGWRNQAWFRIGVEYIIDECFSIRAGYRYGRTVIRPKETLTNLFTLQTVENYVTLGGTWSIDPYHDLSIFLAHGFPNCIKGHHSIPKFFGGGEVDLKQEVNFIGLSFSMLY